MDVQFFISWMTEWRSNVLFYAQKSQCNFSAITDFDGVSQVMNILRIITNDIDVC